MAEGNNSIDTTVESLFKNMEGFLSTKTCVGEPIILGDTILIPFVDVSFGCGAGAASKRNEKNSAMGGITGKMTPDSVLVLQNGYSKVVSLKEGSDMITRLVDMAPEVVERFAKKIPGIKLSKEEVKEAVNENQAAKDETK